jgi:hypothetical protein
LLESNHKSPTSGLLGAFSPIVTFAAPDPIAAATKAVVAI